MEDSMSEATVGDRFQIVIPAAERKKIGIRPRQKVKVQVREGRLIIEPLGSPQVRGLLNELRDGRDATDYVRYLRKEWEKRD
jgi:AbrB family looped-hinge helix DNA binding protein